MLDKFLVLLERFVVAHELIAANSSRKPADVEIKQAISGGLVDGGAIRKVITGDNELPVEGESVIDAPVIDAPVIDAPVIDAPAAEEKPVRKKAAKAEPVPEDDLADEEPEEKKPAKKEVDLTPLRDDIKMMARHIATGESDKCNDLFDEMLEEYGVRTVTKLPDGVVAKFHKDAKALVAKYYDIED